MPNTQDPTPLTQHKRGLTYHDVVLHEDEKNEFEDLQDSLEAELQPQGALEYDLFDQLLYAAWSLRRVRRLEAKLSPNSADPLLDDLAAPALARLARHHARSERSYYRALRAQLQPQPAATLPALASIREMTKRTRTPPPPSNSQILKSSNPQILPSSPSPPVKLT